MTDSRKNASRGKSLLIAAVLSLSVAYPTSVRAESNAEPVSVMQSSVEQALAEPYVEGELVVKFKEGVDPEAITGSSVAIEMKSAPAADENSGSGVIATVELGPGTTVASELADWKKHPLVEYAEPNYIYKVTETPNDPDFKDQLYIQRVKADIAWNTTKGSPGLTVAVLDTGVDLDHPDLVGNLVSGYNAVLDNSVPEDDHVGTPPDSGGHGTHVAGTIAATANNGQGISGVAPNVKIMPVKVLGSNGQGTLTDIIEGIKWAADHGADIINMSLGGTGFSQAYQDAVDYAYNKGVFIIAAAGNDKSSKPHYPAALNHVLSVVALDENNKKASFSNFGATVDISAPGTNIWATKRGGGYEYKSGTSMATPIVSGVTALVWSQRPELTLGQLELLLKSSATDLGSRGRDNTFGYGLIDAAKALTDPADTAAPEISINSANPKYFAANGKNSVKLAYSAAEVGSVTMKVYNDSDVVVRTLQNGVALKKPGSQAVAWNGKSDSNALVPNGTYTYQIAAVDAAGNVSSVQSGTLQLDSSGPTVSSVTYEVYVDSSTVEIRYDLSENAKVTAGIYNGKKLVKTLVSNTVQNAGANSLSWNTANAKNVPAGDGTYSVQIRAIDFANNKSEPYSSNFTFDIRDPDITAVSDGKDPLKLVGSAASTIKFTLSESAKIDLSIYDGNGSLVRKLIDGVQTAPGAKAVKWNGKNDGGATVPDGIYTYKIQATDGVGKFKEASGTITTDSAGPVLSSLTVSPTSLAPNGTDKVEIAFSMSENAKITVAILNGSGKAVYTIAKSQAAAQGNLTYSWDGKLSATKNAPAGSYTVKITAIDSVGFSTSTVSSPFTIV